MTNFEKIDDYLANRLPADDHAAFKQAMDNDAALREEVALQEKIIRSVRQARSAELKQMLQQVPIPSGGWGPAQMAAGVIATGVVATSLYFFFRPESVPPAPAEKPGVPEVIVKPEQAEEPAAKPEAKTTPAEEPKKKTATPSKPKTSPVQKPDIQVADPTTELTDTQEPEMPASTTRQPELTVSKLQVVTQAADKKFTFHYQFAEGKLHLFGPFDRNLYEILEINGDSHAVFLFYKENYYLLDEAKKDITPLAPIRDGQLLKKLREYRSR